MRWGLLVLVAALQLTMTVQKRWERCQSSWTCKGGKCRKVYDAILEKCLPEDGGEDWEAEQEVDGLPPTVYGSFELCRLTCGKYSTMWPRPAKIGYLSKSVVPVDPTSFNFDLDGVAGGKEAVQLMTQMTRVFLENLRLESKNNWVGAPNSTRAITVTVETLLPDVRLSLHTDESYFLDIYKEDEEVSVSVNASTVFGARHALETLSQLVAAYRTKRGHYRMVMVDGASINDFPAFRYRGLMVDTARNYLTLDDLKRTLDGMAASKLNVLHWHATDSHSFPLVSPSVPQLSKYGAYSSRQVYTPDDVHEVLRYAKIRGIRVLLEIDAPSHCGNGWQWGKSEDLGELAVCVNANPWVRYCLQPPCGQLNPINPNLYPILRRLYNDVIEIFKDTEIFHMGGDEVSFKCWNSIGAIKSWLKSHELPVNETGYLELWSMFQQRALAQWDTAAGHSATNIFLWSSQLTASEVIEQYLDKDRYIIETWVDEEDSLPDELLEKGYRLVMVTKSAWYLDHGFWGNTLYHNWKVAYNNQLPRHKGVLGGEAAMWGELVDGRGLDSRVWPRAAAVGERLWTDPAPSSTLPLERLMDHRARLVTRGLDPEAIAPQWCYQNEGLC